MTARSHSGWRVNPASGLGAAVCLVVWCLAPKHLELLGRVGVLLCARMHLADLLAERQHGLPSRVCNTTDPDVTAAVSLARLARSAAIGAVESPLDLPRCGFIG